MNLHIYVCVCGRKVQGGLCTPLLRSDGYQHFLFQSCWLCFKESCVLLNLYFYGKQQQTEVKFLKYSSVKIVPARLKCGSGSRFQCVFVTAVSGG